MLDQLSFALNIRKNPRDLDTRLRLRIFIAKHVLSDKCANYTNRGKNRTIDPKREYRE